MTHYYLYIEAGREIDESTKFYKVAVGTSKQATRDYLFLIAFSESHGHFFSIVSESVQTFLDKIAVQLTGNPQASICTALTVRPISARELVRSFKASCAIPLNPSALSHQHRFQMQTSLDYRVASIIAKRN